MINIKKEIETGIKNFDVLKVEKILNEELNKDKENIDLLLKLSVVELWTPDEDYDKSLEYINRVYKIDNDNIDALIMECSIYNIYFGGVNDRLLNKLAKINIDNKRIMSILKYLMSFYYYKDLDKQIELLEESIYLCDEYVYNYKRLGMMYIEKGECIKGKELIKKSLKNIKLVYDETTIVDFTDINEYINEYITGVHLTYINKTAIEELLI